MSAEKRVGYAGFTLLIGCFIGFLVGGIVAIETDAVKEEYYTKKEICEKSLPRDQVCEMVLVVKEDK